MSKQLLTTILQKKKSFVKQLQLLQTNCTCIKLLATGILTHLMTKNKSTYFDKFLITLTSLISNTSKMWISLFTILSNCATIIELIFPVKIKAEQMDIFLRANNPQTLTSFFNYFKLKIVQLTKSIFPSLTKKILKKKIGFQKLFRIQLYILNYKMRNLDQFYLQKNFVVSIHFRLVNAR